jgi:hypothetical protein
MQNPFPGMNPYMEDPLHWREVHHLIISFIHLTLNRTLPEEFASRIEERVYVEGWGKDYYPDNMVVQVRPSPENRGGVATLAPERVESSISDTPLRLNFGTRTIREAFIEIRTADNAAELIAVIEILSPTNKTAGPGREEYQRKQRDVLDSLVHLVEIDLLRDGTYTVAPPEKGTRERAGKFDYILSLHRGGEGNIFDIWPVPLHQPLPRIRIPLTEEADDITLDLQEIVNRVYEEGGLGRTIRYDKDPVPPLSPENARWANELLQEKGLRQNPAT